MTFSLTYSLLLLFWVANHVISAKCVNQKEECKDWAELGECLKNPRYMYKHCMQSCGVCDDETNTTAATPNIMRNLNILNSEDSESVICEEGVCTIMLDVDVDDPCRDTTPENCRFWANMGECKTNPIFMLSNCAKSCGKCTRLVGSDNDANAEETCLDDDPKGECEDHVSKGDCYFELSNMKKKCAASCVMCVNRNALKSSGVSDEEISRRINYTKMNLGTTQLIKGRDLGERYHSEYQIMAMDVYAKTIAAGSDLSDYARSLCYNQLDDCAYLASKGLCQTRSIFMMSNCPLACMMCEEVEQFHRCVGKTHPFDIPSFKNPEEIHDDNVDDVQDTRTISSFFDVISNITGAISVTDHTEPALYVLDSLIVESDIKEALNLIQGSSEWHEFTAFKADHFDGKFDTTIPSHKSKRLICEFPSSSCHNITSTFLTTISRTLGISKKYFSPPEYLRYEAGDHYASHREYRIHDEWKPAGPRIVSIYIPLTDSFDGSISGGSVGFKRLNWTILTPKKGSLIIWSNVDETLIPDISMETEILPITTGEHYFIVTHIHLHDYERNVALGCI